MCNVCTCTNWEQNLHTYQLGQHYLGCQHVNLLVYIQDPDMHIGHHLCSECSHRVSETSVYSCYLYVYYMVTFGRSVALSGNNFPRCSEYEGKPLFLNPHTLGIIVDLLLDEQPNADISSAIRYRCYPYAGTTKSAKTTLQ